MFGYFHLRLKWDKADERKRIEDWEDKVNGNEIFFFTECDYRAFYGESYYNYKSHEFYVYTFDKPTNVDDYPIRVLEVKGIYRMITKTSVSITYGGPKVIEVYSKLT